MLHPTFCPRQRLTLPEAFAINKLLTNVGVPRFLTFVFITPPPPPLSLLLGKWVAERLSSGSKGGDGFLLCALLKSSGERRVGSTSLCPSGARSPQNALNVKPSASCGLVYAETANAVDESLVLRLCSYKRDAWRIVW